MLYLNCLSGCKVSINYKDHDVLNCNGFHHHEPFSNCCIAVKLKYEELKKKVIENL